MGVDDDILPSEADGASLYLLPFLLAACGAEDAAAPADRPPPAVTVTAVERQDVTPKFEFVGRVEAIESVELRARVEGFIESRDFVEGSDVAEGDLLFVIEQAPYKAEVDARNADVASAQAAYENAKATLARAQALIKKGNISQAGLDEAEAAEKQTRASVLQNQAALDQARARLQLHRDPCPHCRADRAHHLQCRQCCRPEQLRPWRPSSASTPSTCALP